jgi:hypothetical protein
MFSLLERWVERFQNSSSSKQNKLILRLWIVAVLAMLLEGLIGLCEDLYRLIQLNHG